MTKTGKSVNDAITAALDELKLGIDDVHVDILEEGKPGFFGLLSGKPAKVRVSELEEDERMPQPGYAGSERAAEDGADPSDDGGDVAKGDAANVNDDFGDYSHGGANEAGPLDNPDAGGGEGPSGEDDDMPDAIDSEINRATDFLYDILNGLHVSANMIAEPDEEGFILNIESEDSGILIGHRGETLDALQYLVNLYMNKGRDGFIRVTVDVERYKRKREAALKRLAAQMAEKVVRLRRNFTLDAMNSYERRIIHSALQNHPRVETYSVGEDPNRKVVVTLKNRGGYSSR